MAKAKQLELPEKARTVLKLDAQLKKLAKQQAAREGLHMTQLTEKALRFYLAHSQPAKQALEESNKQMSLLIEGDRQ